MATINLVYAMTLPPEKAIQYFVSKGFEFSWNWEDLWQEEHAKAFTVAKVTRLDILQDIQEAVEDAIKNGKTFASFKKELTPLLKAKGWWGRKETTDPFTGEAVTIQEGNAWRLETIYRVNVQTAYMAGRYAEQIENVDDRPYWEYVAVMDDRTRPSHRALDGIVLRHDDPFWSQYYPPNGWNCRCRVTALTEKQGKARAQSSAGRLGHKNEIVSIKSGEMREVATFRTRDPVSGRMLTVSPDVGWSYNPGQASYKVNKKRYTGALSELANKELP
ncbi:phage head morphogenesis protein, SPP1 gp7 family [Oligella urethralis]|nr:phage head morphogenesis protein, SPP1 gp7 family [Oligella urethralis]